MERNNPFGGFQKYRCVVTTCGKLWEQWQEVPPKKERITAMCMECIRKKMDWPLRAQVKGVR